MKLGQTYASPGLDPIRWWVVCCDGEDLLVYRRDDGQWQECFRDRTSKGLDRIYSADHYGAATWRPVLDLLGHPIPATGQPLDGVEA